MTLLVEVDSSLALVELYFEAVELCVIFMNHEQKIIEEREFESDVIDN